MRLQLFISKSGVASRRKAEELIKEGRVLVNGVKITQMGYMVSDLDVVKVDGKKINIEKEKIYILLNKPYGYITSAKDQFSRPTVMDLIKNIKQRIFPIGRLDYDTEGLLILTNDGDFAFRLAHPKHQVEKVYIAEIEGIISNTQKERFQNGIYIDGFLTSKAKLNIIKIKEKTSIVEITIHEGKNRQVRKMMDAINHPVLKLKRVAICNITLGDLPSGSWRYLSKKELMSLN